MNTNNQMKRLFTLLLALVMVVGMLPVTALAADPDPIVLIGGGDYQQAGDHANSSDNVTDILDQIVDAGYTHADGFLFIGDYDCETHDSSSETAAGIESLMATVSGVYSNLDYDNTILVQGNHDYPDSRIDSTGGHDFNGYSVFVMNEDDYPNYGGSESQAKSLAEKMDNFLAGKLAAGYDDPIFITSHVPLHFGPRTNRQGDGKYAGYIFDVLNSYGAEGLNIIFMHGHNHAYGYDEYMGGEAIYLAVGDSINIAKTGSQSSYNTYTLNFTYMNAGYTGYYNESGYATSSGTNMLTMTTFEIHDDKVVIGRYSADGIYNLKTAGEKKGDYISSVSVSANTDVYASTQTIFLTAPAERITLEDAATGVAVTGILVEGSFDDNSDLTVSPVQNVEILDNAAKCAAYQAYDLDFTSSGTVSVSLPVPENYAAASTRVYHVDGSTLTEMDATIAGSAASFTATHGGVYAVVSEVTGITASTYYERVESVSDLVSGEEYLIVFDCSSQTSADAIVIPEIATYSSGSSKRVGPDVMVSDGISDEATIVGDYDDYLWTLTKSGSGWKIGNGSQNINVTYSSTTSRCELNFTTSGEALTIASASSNPSDADSYSFAVYDSSSYYWQYNTSATLIYGTSGDGYTSRFCFYKRVENNAEAPEIANGWISLPSGGTYVLDTDGIDVGEENKYIIVGNSNAYALTVSGGTVGQEAVTISGNTITVDDPAIYEFWFADNSSRESKTYLLTQDGSNTVYHANGNMYYGSDSKGYWYIGSSSNGAYRIYDYDNQNWYLNYGYVWSSESASRFAVSSNSRYVRLYKGTGSVYSGSYVRLAGETSQECTIGTSEAQVLSNVCVQVTNDGYLISDIISVTSDMVTWNTAFDGNTTGTYTGSVTYNDMILGTITVTVANNHSYEAVVTAPTCTEQGYTTYTCTDCGDSYVADYVAAAGHSYEAAVTAPSCTTGGYTTYTCAVCGDTYTADNTAALGHDYVSVTVDATCTEAGTVTYTCACGDTYSETLPATGHDYTAVVTAPTCTEAGYTTYTCEICGHSYVSDHTEALGHDYDSVTVAPTCTEGGHTTYICACGDSYVSDYVDALGHSYETVVVASTCTTGGYTTDSCTLCGEGNVYDETAALGHDYVSVTVEATCTESGCTTHTCTLCGDSYADAHVDALGHTNESVITEATCETDGYTTHTCTVCGEVTVDSYVEAYGHDYETVTVTPTCTEAGSVTATCVTCGHSTTEVIEALGHSYETVTVVPTCTEGGYTTYTCAVCSDSYTTDYLAPLGHDYTCVTVDATCTENGSRTYTCACGDTYTEVIEAAGHQYEAVVTAPTCTEDGYTTHTCAVCGDSYVTDQVAAQGHDYETVTVAPTCTAGGHTTHTCTVCGDSYVSNQITALGHSYDSVTVDATCTTGGYTTYTCSVCGDSYTADQTAALGHSYSVVESNGYLVHTCDHCGDSYSEKLSSTYTKVTALSSGNEYVITLYSGRKYYALSHEDNKISVVQVTVSNNEITSEITDDLVWSYSGSKLSYEDNGTTYYLYAASSSSWWGNWWGTPTLSLSTTNSSTVSFSSSKLKIGGTYYLRYSGGSVSLNRSATTTYLFIEE